MSKRGITFQDVVRTYQQPLYWYIRRIVLVHEDAEDILQETFIKAYRNLWSLRSEAALKAWLYRIATNEVNRYFRRHRDSLPIEEFRTVEPGGSDAASADSVSKVISAAMLRMSPLQKEVFCLKYYDDMDYDDISRITGSNKNSLMVSYHEAKKKIEKEIEG